MSEPTWRTETVRLLAEQMLLSDDYDALPILADALEDADYPDAAVLAEMRLSPGRSAYKYAHANARLVNLVYSDEHAAAVRRIEEFAAHIDQTYNRLMKAADDWVEDDEYTYDNTEAYKSCTKEWSTFWSDYTLLTGRKPASPNDEFFTCSC